MPALPAHVLASAKRASNAPNRTVRRSESVEVSEIQLKRATITESRLGYDGKPNVSIRRSNTFGGFIATLKAKKSFMRSLRTENTFGTFTFEGENFESMETDTIDRVPMSEYGKVKYFRISGLLQHVVAATGFVRN